MFCPTAPEQAQQQEKAALQYLAADLYLQFLQGTGPWCHEQLPWQRAAQEPARPKPAGVPLFSAKGILQASHLQNKRKTSRNPTWNLTAN